MLSIFQSTRPIRGATPLATAASASYSVFQSTRPIRGATGDIRGGIILSKYFNPRAPYGARRSGRSSTPGRSHFNPRAPYGARQRPADMSNAVKVFQSTRPIRGATQDDRILQVVLRISIHAPHTGRDDFALCADLAPRRFQSTRPIRGATR